jgi:hypothetical protein
MSLRTFALTAALLHNGDHSLRAAVADTPSRNQLGASIHRTFHEISERHTRMWARM